MSVLMDMDSKSWSVADTSATEGLLRLQGGWATGNTTSRKFTSTQAFLGGKSERVVIGGQKSRRGNLFRKTEECADNIFPTTTRKLFDRKPGTSASAHSLESFCENPLLESKDSADIEILSYLNSVSAGPDAMISKAMGENAMALWMVMRLSSGRSLPVPAACAGPDGKLLYSWDYREHHLEAEFTIDDRIEFFYRNRNSDECWCSDISGYPKRSLIPDVVINCLPLFTQAE